MYRAGTRVFTCIPNEIYIQLFGVNLSKNIVGKLVLSRCSFFGKNEDAAFFVSLLEKDQRESVLTFTSRGVLLLLQGEDIIVANIFPRPPAFPSVFPVL